MPETIVGLFDDRDHAEMAVRELRGLGIPQGDISLVARDSSRRDVDAMRGEGEGGGATAAGASLGAVLGGLGGLLVGLGALTIPGIGPVLAAGPLSSALGGLLGAGLGAAGGGALGGLVGAMVDAGVPEAEAQAYAEGVRRGGTLLTVRADDDQATRVRDIFHRHHAVDVEQRTAEWRERGWSGYNAQAQPYTAEQIAEERRTRSVAESAEALSSFGTPPPRPVAYTAEETGFRDHYQMEYSHGGRQYEHYQPAYLYGRSLRDDERYRDWDWDRLEPEARRGWEQRSPNTWDQVKEAVRHAWMGMKQGVRRKA